MTRFVLLAAPRTGSNWLCSLLDSHPEVLCHHELFNPAGVHLALSRRAAGASWADPGEREADPAGWLERVWEDHRGSTAVGFKLNLGQSPAAFRAVLDDPAVRKILLSRADCLAAFVSERVAHETGRWESFLADGEPPVVPSFVVGAEELARHAERNRRYFNELRAHLASTCQIYCRVLYEELADVRTHRRLLAYLGVDPERPLSAATRKQLPRDPACLVSNLPELLAEQYHGELHSGELPFPPRMQPSAPEELT